MNCEVMPGLVSVIIPSYNYAAYLERRIESILNQTYKNLEVIVIDDCSSDNSVEILEKYTSNPQITVVVREENGGWIAANNQGVNLATGEFVHFAQCDDLCDLRMIEKLVGAMQSNSTAGLAFCRSLMVDENDCVLGVDYDGREAAFKLACKKDVLLNKQQMVRFLSHSCVIPNLSAVLIRKECFDTVGMFSSDYRVCSDWDWFFHVVEKYDVAYVAEPLNRFMQHESTIRSSTKERVLFGEYFRLLLTQRKRLKLSFMEHCYFRFQVMRLWSVHLLSRSWLGLRNFPYHLGVIIHLDMIALAFLPLALLLRMLFILKRAAGVGSQK